MLKGSLSAVVIACISVATCQVHAAEVTFSEVQAWLTKYAQAPADGLAPGNYDQQRIQDLTAYLAPGVIERFDFPELDVEIAETRSHAPHQLYRDATARYVDQATINKDGQLEGYTAGQPFSPQAIVAATAEKAGTMVAWNQIHRWQYYGYRMRETAMAYVKPTAAGATGQLLDGMVGGGNVDRHLALTYHRVYLSKLATLPDQDYRMDVTGSDELLYKEHMEFLAPFDLAGTQFIIERPLIQSHGDQVNSYLASERRVRRLSAKERSDSFMGTIWTLDDFEGFSGLVTDNTWTLLGHKVIPSILNSKQASAQSHGPTSTIPLDRWQLRPSYVVEAVPQWDGHPYSRRLMFIDKETFGIGLALIFDRNDELYKIFMVVHQSSNDVNEPDPALSVPRWRSSIGINVRDDTATVAMAMKPTEFLTMKPSQVKQLFSISNLTSGR